MKTFRLYLDDIHKTPEGFNVRTFTVEQTIVFLKTRKVEMMSLDHDLGTDPKTEKIRKDGEFLLKWLEEVVNADFSFPIPKILIHSANSVGRDRMLNVIVGIERIRERQTKEKSEAHV